MKKALFGTTALVAVGALAAPALAADPIEIGVSGRWYGYAGFALNGQNGGAGEPGENRRNHGLWHESEIRFTGETTLDNGITVGVKIHVEGETTPDQVDKNYVYFDGNFGRIEIGEISGASFRTSAFLPSAYFFQGPNYGSVIWGAPPGLNGAGTGAWTYAGVWAGDTTRINYFTPRVNGFQLGVSYSPEPCAQDVGYWGQCGRYADLLGGTNDGGEQSEIWDIGSNYHTDLGGMSLGLSVGYQERTLEVPADGAEDQREWAVNGTLGSGSFTVGAGFRQDNRGSSGSDTDETAWAISGNYRMDSWTFGAGYIVSEVGAGEAGGEDQLNAFAIGVDYAFGPGITFMGGIDRYSWEDNENNPAAENSFTALTVGSYISF